MVCFAATHLLTIMALLVLLAIWLPVNMVALLFGAVFVTTIGTTGFAIAASLSRRPSRAVSYRFYLLSSGLGVLIGFAVAAACILLGSTPNPPPFLYTLLLVIGLSASLSQLVLVAAFASGMLHDDPPETACTMCGNDVTVVRGTQCPVCAEPLR